MMIVQGILVALFWVALEALVYWLFWLETRDD